jgi:hypothetical protein
VHVRRVRLGLTSAEEAEPVLDPERIRHRTDEDTARPEDAARLGHERLRKANVFEQLTRDDGIEALALQRKRLLDVGRDDVDAELFRLGKRSLVDVDSDYIVSFEEVAGEGAGAAAEIEHVPSLPDRLLEEWDSLRDKDELPGVSPLAVVGLVELSKRHRATPT